MGLDNMFFIREKATGKEVDVAEAVQGFQYFMGGVETVNIMYMRKYWGVRNEIMEFLRADDMNDYEIPIDAVQLKGIIEILYKFTDKEYFYNNEGSTIWSWEEALKTLFAGICNLKIILNDMENGEFNTEKYELCFLDSY